MGATTISNFNWIDATRTPLIERDTGEGDQSLKCESDAKPKCFRDPSMVKHVVLVGTGQVGHDQQ